MKWSMFICLFLCVIWKFKVATADTGEPAFAIFASGRNQNRIFSYQFATKQCTELLRDLESPTAVDFDPVERKIYWTEYDGGRIGRCDMNGENKEILISNLNEPYGLALDVDARVIYWSSEGGSGAVERANMDGLDRRSVTTGNLHAATHIMLDSSNSHIYVSDVAPRPGEIERVNTDGSGRTRVVGSDLSFPLGIALDKQKAVTEASILLIPTMFRAREKIECTFQTEDQGVTLSPVIKCNSRKEHFHNYV